MKGTVQFEPACLAWLTGIRHRLEGLENQHADSEDPRQPPDLTLQLYRLRRECMLVDHTLLHRRAIGLMTPAAQTEVSGVLRDLRWLLDVSPSAPPALARQCVRIACDRLDDALPAAANRDDDLDLLLSVAS